MLSQVSRVEPGSKFGRWTVIEEAGKNNWGGTYMLCVCDCGTQRKVIKYHLIDGSSVSCGCYGRDKLSLQILGKRFGRLTVVELVPRPVDRKTTGTYCLCQCDCGAPLKIYRASDLRAGKMLGCSCVQRERASEANFSGDPQRTAKSRILRAYKDHAVKRGLEWDITDEQALSIFVQPCAYCGRMDSNLATCGKKSRTMLPFPYNGIDRIDSSKGYTIENVVACCGTHNQMKWDMSVKDFIEECRRVVAYVEANRLWQA